MGARPWTAEQRAAASRRKRGTNELSRKYLGGVEHFELIHHPVCSVRLELVLAYEAYLNKVPLQDWIARHRIGSSGRQFGLYVPEGYSVIPMDGNFHNNSEVNLFCCSHKLYLSKLYYLRKKAIGLTFEDNREEIHRVCLEFSQKVERERKEKERIALREKQFGKYV